MIQGAVKSMCAPLIEINKLSAHTPNHQLTRAKELRGSAHDISNTFLETKGHSDGGCNWLNHNAN
jgi:hypothetical protein